MTTAAMVTRLRLWDRKIRSLNGAIKFAERERKGTTKKSEEKGFSLPSGLIRLNMTRPWRLLSSAQPDYFTTNGFIKLL
jgi:hypothetical protein